MEKRSNIHVIGATQGEEREYKLETIFNGKLTDKFPRLMKDIKPKE